MYLIVQTVYLIGVLTQLPTQSWPVPFKARQTHSLLRLTLLSLVVSKVRTAKHTHFEKDSHKGLIRTVLVQLHESRLKKEGCKKLPAFCRVCYLSCLNGLSKSSTVPEWSRSSCGTDFDDSEIYRGPNSQCSLTLS